MSYRLFSLLAAATAGLALAGCGGPDRPVAVHKTSGRITFESRPIAGAFVVLHPKGETAADVPKPRAEVEADGTFVATTFEAEDGAPAGEYVLTVELQQIYQAGSEFVRSPNLLPPKYASAATSDVVVEVVEGENTLPLITLRR